MNKTDNDNVLSSEEIDRLLAELDNYTENESPKNDNNDDNNIPLSQDEITELVDEINKGNPHHWEDDREAVSQDYIDQMLSQGSGYKAHDNDDDVTYDTDYIKIDESEIINNPNTTNSTKTTNSTAQKLLDANNHLLNQDEIDTLLTALNEVPEEKETFRQILLQWLEVSPIYQKSILDLLKEDTENFLNQKITDYMQQIEDKNNQIEIINSENILYSKEYKIYGNKQIFFMTPVSVINLLIGQPQDTEPNDKSKEAAEKIIFKNLEEYFADKQKIEVTAADQIKTVTWDEKLITEYKDDIFPIKNALIGINYIKDTKVFLFSIKATVDTMLKIVGEKPVKGKLHTQGYYKKQTGHVVFGKTYLSEEEISSLKKGTVLHTHINQLAPLDYEEKGIKKAEVFPGVNFSSNNDNFSAKVVSINKEDWKNAEEKETENQPNTYIIFGTKAYNLLNPQNQPLKKDLILQLDTEIRNLFPLVCNNKIVAQVALEREETGNDFMDAKVMNILDKPISLI